MYRFALSYLKEWKDKPGRKPLIVRGARQVGKSFLVQMLAREEFDSLVEINFEREPEAATLFESKSPRRILPLLEARYDRSVSPGKSLLFLDEIQAAPMVLAALRYFHEELPELHVVAAGSLLEFVLEEPIFSMPVGRIEYLHLGPMQFEEYLLALGRDKLREFLRDYAINEPMPEGLHLELMRLLRQFTVLGGMPESIKTYLETNSQKDADAVKQSILSTYRDDFNKYRTRVEHGRISKVFAKIPLLVGQKFKYSEVDRDERARSLARALDLLCLARVAHRVNHSDANGLPLGAEANDRDFKVLFMDVGLLCRSCGLNLADVEAAGDMMLVNSGTVAEQLIGQHLFYCGQFFEEPELHYWRRQKASSSAELDYVRAVGPHIVPIEVKAGKTGRLKSLHLFLRKKGLDFGLRFNSDVPSLMEGEYRLLSLPLYMVGQARRLCREVLG